MSTIEQRAEEAWIAYRNDIQRRAVWEDHRRTMRRLRKRDFLAGYLAGAETEDYLTEEANR